MSRDVPLIINVSVLETDVAAGEIEVRWTKPDATDLDTLQHPPPYRYQLLRRTGLVAGDLQPVPGADFISPTYWQANDTMFIDAGLNTVENPYIYAVAFYTGVASEVHAEATPASSVFLSVASTDNTNILSWDQETPWTNFLYAIYRYNDLTAQFDSIGFSTGAGYTASFSGGMRNVLYGLLDKYRINEYLGIESCEELWGESNHDVHFTSTLRNPTFIAKDLKDYTGGSPVALDKHPLLKRHIQTLAVELNASKDSLIIPLGEKVARVIQMMVDEKLLPLSRVLNFEGRVAEFPHPRSKSNKESVNLAMLDELPEQADYVKEMWDDSCY